MYLHRKLFKTNGSVSCTTACGAPSCLSGGCYSSYYYPNSTSSPSHQTVDISALVIVFVAVLLTLFLLLSYNAVLLKYCFSIGQHLPPVRQNASTRHFNDHGNASSFRIDDPIWLINRAGLDQSIIDAVTTFGYKMGEGALIDVTECSVCLVEFMEGENLKLLPKCNHAFHITCVDTWLRSHTNCPLCRAEIIVLGRLSNGRPSLSSRRHNNSQSVENPNGNDLMTTHNTLVECRNDEGVNGSDSGRRVNIVEAALSKDFDQSKKGLNAADGAKKHCRSASVSHLDSLLRNINHSSGCDAMHKVTGVQDRGIVNCRSESSTSSKQSNNRSCTQLMRSYSWGA